MSKFRLGVFGGTFDPIHNGHLVAASVVAEKFKLDRVLFVPAGDPWQKSETTDAVSRFEMTKLAIDSNPIFEISRVDIDRAGPTYTVDTLRDIRAEFADAEIFFITGADAIAGIASWKDVEQLWGMAEFIAVSRPGFKLEVPKSPHLGANPSITLVEIPALAIASTDIRAKVKAGISVADLVPAGVAEYIANHHLYQGNK